MLARYSTSLLRRTLLNPRTLQARWSSSTSTPLLPLRRQSKAPRRIGYTLGAGLGIYAFGWWDDKYNERTVTRNFRTLYHGLAIAVDYKLNYDPDDLEKINALHERAATRLLDVCEKNRGLYVKMAQAFATQGALLPPPYMKLAKLMDDAEHVEYEVVCETVERELGAPIEDLFVRFDPEPIAAASIAQVHRARIRLPNGEEEEVAVKVQRPDIRRHAKWDLWAYRTLLQINSYVFDIPLSFIAQYISDQILQETKFDNEAINSETIRQLVLSSPDSIIRETVYVPRIYPDYCTPRVLTMEFIEGASKLTDVGAIEREGLDKKKVLTSVVEVMAAQVFNMGFVQADGHPSNVLIRKHPNNKPGAHQVILIDHGLYIPLSPQFRRQYSELWYAIFIADVDTVKRICRGWGIGQAEFFASATLLKPWKAGSSEHTLSNSNEGCDSENSRRSTGEGIGGFGDEEERKLRKEMKERGMEKKEIDKMVEKKHVEAAEELIDEFKKFLLDTELIPKELVFIGRAMRILQANNQAMGSPVNRLKILAKHASSGLIQSTDPLDGITTPSPSFPATHSPRLYASTSTSTSNTPIPYTPLTSPLQRYISYFRFRTALVVMDVAFHLTGWVTWYGRTKRRVLGAVWYGKDYQRGDDRKLEGILELEEC